MSMRAPSEGAGVVDGELVALREGRLEFAALQTGRQQRAHKGITVHLVVFDLIAVADRDLRGEPYEHRRAALEAVIGAPRRHLQVVEMTTSRNTALEWMECRYPGLHR